MTWPPRLHEVLRCLLTTPRWFSWKQSPLFSDQKIQNMLDPSVHANRSAVERHHLFPKAHLHKVGITETRETNQIANFAPVEWGDNADISDRSPAEYLPVM